MFAQLPVPNKLPVKDVACTLPDTWTLPEKIDPIVVDFTTNPLTGSTEAVTLPDFINDKSNPIIDEADISYKFAVKLLKCCIFATILKNYIKKNTK